MSNLNLGLLKNKVGAPADLDAGGVEIASSAGPGWAWHNAHILSGAILLLCLFELILDSIQRNTVHLLRVSAAALKPLVSLWMKRTISLKPLCQRPVKLTLCVFLWMRGLWECNRRVVEPQSFGTGIFCQKTSTRLSFTGMKTFIRMWPQWIISEWSSRCCFVCREVQ